MFGERIRPSPYKIEFMKNSSCVDVCKKEYKGNDKTDNMLLATLRKGISLSYKHHWIVDNMPVTYCSDSRRDSKVYCATGFKMGCYTRNKRTTCDPEMAEEDALYIFNHVDLRITYHSGVKEEWGSQFGSNGGRIISVKVTPRSVDHSA